VTIPSLIYQELRALVSDRVYPNRFPQGNALPVWPAIRYTIVFSDPAASICGTDPDVAADDTRVQIDIVAETYSGMRTLKANVITALDATDPPSKREPGGFETFDEETRTHRAVLDYTFHPSSAP